MNVTIVSASTGGGHNSAMQALRERFAELGAETRTVDLYSCCGRSACRFVERSYLFVSQRMRRGYRGVYRMLESYPGARRAASAATRQSYVADCLGAALGDTDVIVSAHPFAAHALDTLIKRGDLAVPVVALVTDWCVQPFIEDSTSLTAVCFPSPLLLPEAEAKGVKNAVATGLPVRREFMRSMPACEARSELGLDPERGTVLVMGGSMGYGNMFSTVSELLSAGIQTVCICGSNEALRRKLERLEGPLLALGFTDMVALCMDAADLIVTKAGGLTVTELIAKWLPAVIAPSIPGQEERNGDFLISHGGAVRPEAWRVAAEAAALLTDRARLAAMSEALGALQTPDACDEICSLAIRLARARCAQTLKG
jgi:processive 1,2-diacylglycerol beta-glucosyltransferase